jgi:anaerobic selenocysteine-containing dehydrogenase
MPATIHLRSCHLCEACCGIEVHIDDGAVTAIKGDALDPLSRGHICPKATAIADIQGDPERLRAPVRRVGESWLEISWDAAFDEVAERITAIRTEHGIDAIATYVGNPVAHNYELQMHQGGLLRQLGKRNRFSASTVDQMPHQLVNYWLYGHQSLFPVPDVDRTGYMLILGGNPLASNGSIWTVPDVKKRLAAVQARGGKVVVIDPRRTETAQVASEHLFIRPSRDAAFLIGLLLALKAQGRVNPGRLAPMLDGWDNVWSALDSFALDDMASACGIDAATIARLARELADAPSATCYGRIGVSTQAYGTLCQWLIHLINIAIGSLDSPGGPMFASPAVDFLPSSNPGSWGRYHSRVSGVPEVCGELPAALMAEEMLTLGAGQIRALYTCAGNPVLSTPNGRQLEKALAGLDFMVSVDTHITETTRFAHIILPPGGPLERSKFDMLFNNLAVRNVARFSPATIAQTPGSLADWQIVSALAARLAARQGNQAATLPPPEQMLDLALQAGPYGLTLDALKAQPHGIDLGAHVSRLPERLFTPDKRIHCAPPLLIADLERFRADLGQADDRPLVLIGRRHVRSNNSWMHQYARLVKGPDRCTLMINPGDARSRNLGDGAQAKLASRVGSIPVTIEVTDTMMPGVVSLPHGWGHHRPGTRQSVATAHAGVSINDITDEHRRDPLSGNAAVSGVPVDVSAI